MTTRRSTSLSGPASPRARDPEQEDLLGIKGGGDDAPELSTMASPDFGPQEGFASGWS
jgi:hypothetical protein